MRKLITSINMTLDGFCDHEAGIVDEELHEKVNELFNEVDTVIFGRVTYQLMEEGWPSVVMNPTGIKSVDEFAVLIDRVQKIVFSHTLKQVSWNNTRLAEGELIEEVKKLKQMPGKNMLAGGPSIIDALMVAGLIDEYYFWVHPIVLGKGLPLFKNIPERINLKLINTITLGSGVVILHYQPA